ncbi:protocadherin-7-like [Mizuhopecten yessoensis]|uniref:Protocadherin-20 n=1 Tax=Mizuhopecten yessoensis TaxID=6573 RepID=A0A210PXU9_MIZYE|nr:protocadherin-7-like [Mizuhopecten yessoensis]XP_021372403.1 protocadherin-7-like [Mizuhopecten yessoensis]XP_021372405.1 protocadherin-7-like [Mizuhopecten yessoensis]XP_021372406.1 protocadherin-7-like [Mizuhopecten yessoensis]OWF41279.1 Protocadherin-11 X-linked [Mizuhopecten yessoensis]
MMAASLHVLVCLILWIVSPCHGQDELPAIEFITLEEQPVGTLIGKMSDAEVLKTDVVPAEFNSLTFRLLDSGTSSQSISVVEQSGNVYLEKVLDREALCGYLLNCQFTFDVAVRTASNSYITILTAQVTIQDKNDHVPLFPASFLNLQVSENDQDTKYTIAPAEDKDIGNFSIQSYEIVQQSDIFGLEITKNQDQSLSLQVILKKELDREEQNRYQFHVVAKDGGDPPNSGTLSISVEVLDENDNNPNFLESEYSMSVKEKTAAGTIVLQVLATDKDMGVNGQITYRFSPHQQGLEQIQQVFTISQQTGEISLSKTLSANPGTVFQFYVDASDQGDQAKVTQQLVTVTVVDGGNNPPELLLSYIITSDNGVMNISESAKNATPLVHVRVDDSDSGLNGNVSCTINDTNFTLQPVAGKGFIVMTNNRLDREIVQRYYVTVLCEDKGSPPLSSVVNFTVNVTDENDRIPRFSKGVYPATLTENSNPGGVVTQVSASDDDIGRNAQVNYYLHDDSVSKFAINSHTGVITANMKFDREVNPRITFRVLAVDGGNPQQTGTATVVLTITDINDNAPSFNSSGVEMMIQENREPLTKVGELKAVDSDEGNNGRVVYSLLGNVSRNLPFIVYQDGVVRAKESLDREVQSVYTFHVRARDQGDTPLETNISVTVHITDDNDNSPVFVFPNDSNDTVSIGYLAETPSWITKISAADRDTDQIKAIVYSIRHGNDLQLFSIDPYTGDLYLLNTHMVSEDTSFRLMLSAEDNGSPRRVTTHSLHVILVYTNATSLAHMAENTGNKYIIISAVVVVLTVILSAVIIALILFLRRKDQRQELARKLSNDIKNENSRYLENGKVCYGEKQDFSGCNGDLYKQKKKKEVSFSLDEDLDNVFDISSVSAYNVGKHEHAEKMKTFQPSVTYDPQTIQTLHLHQLLIQNQDTSKDKNLKKLNVKSPHDDISDTSGETTTSDSGRGGSDMDVPSCTNMPDDAKAYNFNSHHGYQSSSGSTSYLTCGSPTDKEEGDLVKPRPVSDIYSLSSKQKDFKHLTPRENFERKHNLQSSAQKTGVRGSDTTRQKPSDWSPSYV